MREDPRHVDLAARAPSVLPTAGAAGRVGRKAARASETGAAEEISGLDQASLALAVLQGTLDVESLLRAKNAQGIDALRHDIIAIDHRASEELKRHVHEHYTEVILAAESIVNLDTEMSALRRAINANAKVVQGLREIAEQPLKLDGAADPLPLNTARTIAAAGLAEPWGDASASQAWHDVIDELDTAVGERRVDDALSALATAEALASEMAARETSGDAAAAKREALTAEVADRVAALAPVLEARAADPTASTPDVRAAVAALARVAGPLQAHGALLRAHGARIRRAQNALVKPQHSGGSDSQGREYAAALAQRTFLCLADAVEDAEVVFGDGTPELSALLTAWALQQAESACTLLKTHAIDQYAAPAGLDTVVSLLLLFSAYAAALEVQHAMRLGSTCWRMLWPSLEQVLSRHLRRLGDDIKAAVEVDVTAMASRATPTQAPSTWEGLAHVFPHLDLLGDEVRALREVLLPLAAPRVGSFMRKALSELFMVYTKALKSCLGNYVAADGLLPESMEPEIELLMEGATLLIEQRWPAILAPLTAAVGDVIDVRHLVGLLDSTAQAFGLVEAA